MERALSLFATAALAATLAAALAATLAATLTATLTAALTAALTAGQAWTRRNLLWTATGLPISDVEIWPWPKKFHGLVNPGYGVAQVIGLQGGPGTVDAILLKNPHHEPTANYFPKIEPSWLLP